MIVTYQQVTDYISLYSYKEDISSLLDEVEDLYTESSFGQKLRHYFKDNSGTIDFSDIEVICSNADDLTPLGWDPDYIHSIAKACTDPDTKDIAITHNTDVFEIADRKEYENLLIYFLYHELTHRLRLENGCDDSHFNGELSKEYIMSEGELNAFMVQYATKLFNGAVLDQVYSAFDLTDEEKLRIKSMYKAVIGKL